MSVSDHSLPELRLGTGAPKQKKGCSENSAPREVATSKHQPLRVQRHKKAKIEADCLQAPKAADHTVQIHMPIIAAAASRVIPTRMMAESDIEGLNQSFVIDAAAIRVLSCIRRLRPSTTP